MWFCADEKKRRQTKAVEKKRRQKENGCGRGFMQTRRREGIRRVWLWLCADEKEDKVEGRRVG